MRAALQHLAASGRASKGLAATAALGPYWLDRGPMREGRDWLDRFLLSATGPPRVRAIGEGWSARLALEQGDVGASPEGGDLDEQLCRAREVLDREGDATEWLRVTDHLSNSLHLQGRFADADALLAEGLERCGTPETAWLRAELMLTRAVYAQDSGGFARERVVALFEEAAGAARLAGHDRARAQAIGRMSITLPPQTPFVTDARTEIEHAFRLSQELGDQRNAARSAVVAAILALADHDRAGAATWFVRSLDVSVAIGYWHGVAWSVMGVAGMAAHAGRLVDGARLHGAMRPRLDQISKETPQAQITGYHRLVDLLRDGLGETFEAECQKGERARLDRDRRRGPPDRRRVVRRHDTRDATAAWPASLEAPPRAHGTRARSAGRARGRAQQRGDRLRARDQPQDRHASHRQRLPQAGRTGPCRGGGPAPCGPVSSPAEPDSGTPAPGSSIALTRCWPSKTTSQ